MVTIGIFWFWNGSVFGKAEPVEQGCEGLPGLVDSNTNHADWWDESAAISGLEYFEVPRGRVLFHRATGKSIVYADRKILNDKGKQAVAGFFGLEVGKIIWKRDPHYTTSRAELGRVFEE